MQTIYTPKGRAREYAELALNLYRGCTHACSYCYVPVIFRMKPEDFHAASVPRRDVLRSVENIAHLYSGFQVFLCFTCDPYGPAEVDHGLTRQAIEILHRHNVGVRILTKGGARSMRDFDLLGTADSYGATLTFCSHYSETDFEPGAARWQERAQALMHAHSCGIPTWASLEPVIDPEQTLELIHITYGYVDEYKIGRWNHDKRADAINWKTFVRQAVSLLEVLGKKYVIKDDLKGYLA